MTDISTKDMQSLNDLTRVSFASQSLHPKARMHHPSVTTGLDAPGIGFVILSVKAVQKKKLGPPLLCRSEVLASDKAKGWMARGDGQGRFRPIKLADHCPSVVERAVPTFRRRGVVCHVVICGVEDLAVGGHRQGEWLWAYGVGPETHLPPEI